MSAPTRLAFAACVAAAAVALGSPARAQDAGPPGFRYNAPGALVSGSGRGRADAKVYAPSMRFPIEKGPAYPNSQVWGVGGLNGPAGSQCDARNYSYPWKDNYCETRTYNMPLCPAGQGHQGQDIRPATCAKDVHDAVAAADGTVTNIGSYSVYVTGADGTRYDYLHMSNVAVKVNDKVKQGQRIGKVSNVFGGTATTIHLHFNLMQTVANVGRVYVPPYTSLVQSYQRLYAPPAAPGEAGVDATAVEGGFVPSEGGAPPAPRPPAEDDDDDGELASPDGEGQTLADDEGGCSAASEGARDLAAGAPLAAVALVAGGALARRRRRTPR